MSGVVSAKIAASFTMAELAVLTVIARQCQRTVCIPAHRRHRRARRLLTLSARPERS